MLFYVDFVRLLLMLVFVKKKKTPNISEENDCYLCLIAVLLLISLFFIVILMHADLSAVIIVLLKLVLKLTCNACFSSLSAVSEKLNMEIISATIALFFLSVHCQLFCINFLHFSETALRCSECCCLPIKGFNLSDRFYEILLRKYDRMGRASLSFDDFIQCCVVVQVHKHSMCRQGDGFRSIKFPLDEVIHIFL